MNKKTLWPLLLLLLGAGVAYLLATSKPVPQPQAVPESPPPAVDVVILTPAARQVAVRSYGSVRAQQQIDLSAEVGGRIVDVAESFVQGGSFAAGEPLLQIDPRDYDAAIMRARAQLADAEQKLATERGEARQAQREWRELGSAEANALYLREPQLKAAEAFVEAARAELQQAQANRERSTIRVPFAGRIREVNANLGQYLAPGAKLATVYSTARMEVVLPLTEREQRHLELDALNAGEDIAVRLWDEQKSGAPRWTATVRRTQAAVDEKTRVLGVIAEIDVAPESTESALPILPGRFVQAELQGRAYPHTLEIPRGWLRGGNVIWLADAENRLQVQTVEVLHAADEQVLVRLPDSRPLRVVSSYLAQAEPGTRLLVNEAHLERLP